VRDRVVVECVVVVILGSITVQDVLSCIFVGRLAIVEMQVRMCRTVHEILRMLSQNVPDILHACNLLLP
jgi:hypothetical protein